MFGVQARYSVNALGSGDCRNLTESQYKARVKEALNKLADVVLNRRSSSLKATCSSVGMMAERFIGLQPRYSNCCSLQYPIQMCAPAQRHPPLRQHLLGWWGPSIRVNIKQCLSVFQDQWIRALPLLLAGYCAAYVEESNEMEIYRVSKEEPAGRHGLLDLSYLELVKTIKVVRTIKDVCELPWSDIRVQV